MVRLFVSVIFVLWSSMALAAGTSTAKLVGEWESISQDFGDWEYHQFTVAEDLSIKWSQKRSSGESSVYTTPGNQVYEKDGIYTISFYNEDSQLSAKLILSGWKSSIEILFGYLFIYRTTGEGPPSVINGYDVTFYKRGDTPLYEQLAPN